MSSALPFQSTAIRRVSKDAALPSIPCAEPTPNRGEGNHWPFPPATGNGPHPKHLPPPGKPPWQEDALTAVLDHLKLRCMLPGQHRMTAPWGIRLPAGPGTFLIVNQGQCCVQLPDLDQTIQVQAGDLMIILPGHKHFLKDKPESPAKELHEMLTPEQFHHRVGLRHGGGGQETLFISAGFFFDTPDQSQLPSAFSSFLHIPANHPALGPMLPGLIHCIRSEQQHEHPGKQTIIDHLAHVLFVHAVRHHLACGSQTPNNWLHCTMDPNLGPALAAIHQRPQQNWTVASLAKVACLSRSSFAARFTQKVGKPPLAYLLEYRMNKACSLLTDSPMVLKEIAQAVGYSSQASFANAFRRWADMAPGAYRRQHRKQKKTGR